MGNKDLKREIDKVPHLAFKYLGSRPPDHMINLPLPKNTFQIVNTDNGAGDHWVVFINKDNIHYFGDSSGTHIDDYFVFNDCCKKQVVHICHSPIQQTEGVCGLFCIYFAHLVFSKRLYVKNISEFNMFKFVNSWLRM